MLQFPYAVNPNNSQAIDGSLNNVFSCIISGTICTAYQAKILDNNTNNVLYDSTKKSVLIYNMQELDINIPKNSFTNGKDLIWTLRLWSDKPDMPIVSGATLEGSTTTKIKVRDYTQIKVGHTITIGLETRTISAYETGTITVSNAFTTAPAKGVAFRIVSDFIDTPYYFFKSRTTPVIAITNFISKITDREYDFTASYTQAENVSIKYHVFNLYNGNTLVDTTGQVFSADFNYGFDGFMSGEIYDIEFICVSQDSVEVTTGRKSFSVEYQAPNIDTPPTAETLRDKDAVKLTWYADKQSIPETTGSWEIVENFPFDGTNSVKIHEDSTITYNKLMNDPLYIDENNFTVLLSTNLPNTFEGKIVELDGDSGEFYVSLEGINFYSYKDGVKTKIGSIYENVVFLLQPGYPQDGVGYLWIDEGNVWNDNYIWNESKVLLSTKQYKITMNPDGATITEVIA